jgi:hypothetical protein
VTAVNDTPRVATNAGRTVAEGADSTITDSHLAVTDVESGPSDLTYEVTTAPANGQLYDTNVSASLTSGATFTQADLNGESIEYRHDGSETVADSFAVVASDPQGAASDTATFQVTIEPVNDRPVASDDNATTDEDQPVTVSVLANDTDPEAALDTSTVQVTSPPAIGTTSVDAATGAITYAPDADSNGTDRFAYAVADAGGLRDTAQVSLTVRPVNDRPVARADTAEVLEGREVEVDLLANDTDVEGRLDTSSVEVVSGPSVGQVIGVTDGVLTYEASAEGADSLRYRVADRVGEAAVEEVKADTAQVRVEVVEVALTAGRDTAEAGVAQVGQPGGEVAVTFTNEGEAALTGLEASLSGPGREDFALVDTSEALGGGELAPGSGRTVTVAFGPGATGRRVAELSIRAEEGAVDTTVIAGRGLRLSASAVETPDRGEAAEIAVTVEGGLPGSALDLGTSGLYVRRSGTESYQEVGLSEEALSEEAESGSEESDTLRLGGEVPSALVTPRGVDYYAALVTDPPGESQQGSSQQAGSRQGESRHGSPRQGRSARQGRVQADTLTVPAGGLADARRRPKGLAVRFDSLEAPVELEAEAYRMVTVPVRPEEGRREALQSAYGAYDQSEWRALRWSAEEERYREYPQMDSLRAGEGFWLITEEGEEPTLGPGEAGGTRGARRIPMETGWNQVGSPHGFAVSWSRIREASGLEEESVDGPVGYSDSTGYRRGRSVLRPWRGYFVFSAEADTLVVPPEEAGAQARREEAGPLALAESRFGGGGTEPGVEPGIEPGAEPGVEPVGPGAGPRGERPGEAGEAASGEAVSGEAVPGEAQALSPGPAEGTAEKRTAEKGEPSAKEGTAREGGPSAKKGWSSAKKGEGRPYTLRISAQAREARAGRAAGRVWLGLRAGARRGRDRLDFAQVPPIGKGPQLWTPVEVTGRAVRHAGSFKPEGRSGQVWELVLKNPGEKAREVRLRIEREGTRPSGHQRYVLDLSEERRVAAGQALELEGGERRRLRVIVGTEAFAEQESGAVALNTFKNELRGNYPNPFGEETRIGYTLGAEQEVTIEVYNVLGQRVRTLAREESREAGLHRLTWAGENRYGEPVGSGVYFLRLEARDFTATRKMVLVR